jgi:pimeloyl-ACP methyl ester carboxylesterase
MFHNIAYFEGIGKAWSYVPVMNYREHHYISHDGLSLYFRKYGTGKNVILCLHGLTRNSKDFHEIATRLESSYCFLCPDLRGRGQSGRDPNWRQYHPGTYIRDAWALADRSGIDRFIILGTSLGGLLGMIMASQQPERIRALMLNDIGPEVDPAGYSRILDSLGRQYPVENWLDAVDQCRDAYGAALPDMPPGFWDDFARKSFREGAGGIPEPDLDPNIARAILEGKPSRVAGVPVDPWGAFRAVSMPCLVLRGELSDCLSEKIVDRMSAVKQDLKQAVVPGRGHAPLLDEPASLVAIEGFLDNLS